VSGLVCLPPYKAHKQVLCDDNIFLQHKTIPRSSLGGMMLEFTAPPTILQSDQKIMNCMRHATTILMVVKDIDCSCLRWRNK